MENLIIAGQFLLSLSILIVLHELGHFIPAKLFKTKVEKFYLFFDYKFSLFKKKIGETVYGIGWIPLGGYVKINEYFEQFGFKKGDIFIAVDGKPLEDVSKIGKYLFLRNVSNIEVLHADGSKETLQIPENIGKEMWTKNIMNPFTPLFPAVIDSVIANKPAYKSGFMKSDKVIAVNGQKTPFWSDFTSKIKNSNNQPLEVVVERNNTPITLTVTPENNLIGVSPFLDSEDVIKSEHKDYTFTESIQKGSAAAYWTLRDYISQFKYVFTKKGASSMGGFISIAKIFKPVWDWKVFWSNTAFLSIMLGFMNLLPIPALDGGHVVFTLYEMITGRKPGDKFLEYAQITGFVLLLSLLAFANGNDLYKMIMSWL